MTRAVALALCAALTAGCELSDRVNRPLPATFAVRALDGTRMGRDAFAGRAWVLPIWVPG